MLFSGKRKIMKSTEAESPLKAPNKIWKRKVENLRKKILRNPERGEYIVARTVSRLARSSNESARGSTKKAAGLQENYAGRATPNGYR